MVKLGNSISENIIKKRVKEIQLQGHTVQQREYSQYFIMAINVVKPLKIMNFYIVHL